MVVSTSTLTCSPPTSSPVDYQQPGGLHWDELDLVTSTKLGSPGCIADGVLQRRQDVRQPGLPHPVAQVRRIAAGHQQDVSLPDPRDPPLLADAGQRCQLEDAQRLPAQVAHGWRHLAGDETPGRGWPAHGVAVLRRGDAEGTGVGDRLAQQVDQRIADARVLDARRREKEASRCPPIRVRWIAVAYRPGTPRDSSLLNGARLSATGRSLRRSGSSARSTARFAADIR
jgi:hypothetical protein